MNTTAIARLLLLLSVGIAGITAGYQLDTRNIYIAYSFAAAAAAILIWPFHRMINSKQLRFIGEMPKMKDVFVYEFVSEQADNIGKRVTTQKIRTPDRQHRWVAIGLFKGTLIEEQADHESEAISRLLIRLKTAK